MGAAARVPLSNPPRPERLPLGSAARGLCLSRQPVGVKASRAGAAAGAQPAGPPPLPPAAGDVTEVDRTVNASGNVSLGDRIVSAGLPQAGQRVTLRLEGPVVHVPAVSWPALLPAPFRRKPGSG